MTVLIYSTPTCPYCKTAKEFLLKKNIPFTDFDVSKDAHRAEEMIKKSGQMGVPVLQINETIIVGFDRNAIEQALGKT